MADPLRNFRFRLEIDGIQQAGFSEVSGFDVTVEPIDYRKGSDPTGEDKARWEVVDAWPTKYGPLSLNAKNNEVSIERLELCNEGVVRVQ